ncbi:hypothetical protein D3C78_1075770 [compost metagenome]
MQRALCIQPGQQRQLADLPAKRDARARQPGPQPEPQRTQQTQQIGIGTLQRINGDLQIINALLEHLRYIQGCPAMLHQAQRADQGGAHAIVHVPHQALAFLQQDLPALDGAQAFMGLHQLLLLRGQPLRQRGVGLCGGFQRMDVALKGDAQEQRELPQVQVGQQVQPFDVQ